ncbi:MAG: NAD-dependent epimerase/dehydratase family protein [Candidatus Omnitrophica bacterium]|nr:NAD-dependent epimerase/dehydratase family protein [Candidatus Omnitrophota bacterium]
MKRKRKLLVAGAGGFIGGHLVRYLVKRGYWVRGVDLKYPEFMKTRADDFRILDLRIAKNCLKATEGIDEVFQLAANMGGIKYITDVRTEVMRDNVLINVNMLEAAKKNRVSRYFFSSSACVYATYKQKEADNPGLKEGDAYPADPDNEYGWEKLFTERLCKNYYSDYHLNTRIARFHNIYGPYGTYDGGREKSPAALCRKVAMAKNGGKIEIWGDGKQARSYCYIDDCLIGLDRLMRSAYRDPLNIGSDRIVTIDKLADIIINISGKKLTKVYNKSKPQGVRGRNSDNSLVRKALKWEPKIDLEKGLKATYYWIESELRKRTPRRARG